MQLLTSAIDLFLHLDRHLNDLARHYGAGTYLILFLIVFCETGLVVTPFLPGDSLLFAVGALAATEGSPLHVGWVSLLLFAAALTGDNVNYLIGHIVGPRVFTAGHSRWFRHEHLDRTHEFFERYGGKTILLARFVPIVRTFAPFVAGVGAMTYGRFLLYCVVAAVAWVGLIVYAGYFFGNVPVVKQNFSLVVLAIIFISVLPAVIHFVRGRAPARAETKEPA
jgi:membrane-associated protein